MIQDDQTSQDPLIPDDQTIPDPVIQDGPDLVIPDQSSSDNVVSGDQDAVALDSKVLDDPSPVIDDCTSSVDVTSNVHEIQDGIKTHVVQQELSDLKKRVSLLVHYIYWHTYYLNVVHYIVWLVLCLLC